jgi:hypothetical protein
MKKGFAIAALWLWLLGNPMTTYSQTNKNQDLKETLINSSNTPLSTLLTDYNTKKTDHISLWKVFIKIIQKEINYIHDNWDIKDTYAHINILSDNFAESLVQLNESFAKIIDKDPNTKESMIKDEAPEIDNLTNEVKSYMDQLNDAISKALKKE